MNQTTKNRLGTSGPNAFYGPGLYNVDLSLSRFFRLPSGESGRLTIRADIFNVLNHANLNNPSASVQSSDFGLARYGRRGIDTGIPNLTPLSETPRHFQLMLRVEF